MPFSRCQTTRGKIPIDVFILHGYRSSVKRVDWLRKKIHELGYSVIMCEFVGHGAVDGDRRDVFSSMEYIERAIDSRNNPVVLIGHSMGGAMALSIASRLGDKISQVFAIAAPNGLAFMKGQAEKTMRKIGERLDDKTTINFVKTMPIIHGSCNISRGKSYFLLHCESDTMVPVSECLDNKELFCIPERNIFIKPKISGVGMMDHWLIFRHKDTLDVISSNIIR